MAGRRKIQRSVRVTVAVTLMGVTVLAVGWAVLLSVVVGPAAVLGLLAGATAVRIMYGEVVQTRREAARRRATQARSFRAALATNHAEHQAYSAMMADRLTDRDRTIAELSDTVRGAGRRADEAEMRVRRESRRANEAQERLAALLDEVFGTADADAVAS